VRLLSLDNVIGSLKAEGRDASLFERERTRVLGLGDDDADQADTPAAHPDAQELLALAGGDPLDHHAVANLNARVTVMPPEGPRRNSVRAEAEHYANSKPDKTNQAAALKLLIEAVGDKLVGELDGHDWRRFNDLLDAKDTWGETTKVQNRKRVVAFLHFLEQFHGLHFPWVKCYGRTLPMGKKVKYTLEEMRFALAHAEGLARVALIMGMNFGWTVADLEDCNPDDLDGDHITKVRAKLKAKRRISPSWLVWPETREVMRFNVPATRYEYAFGQFKDPRTLAWFIPPPGR
jgi:hypothetical protein